MARRTPKKAPPPPQDTRWRPGVSGNPSGRPKATMEQLRAAHEIARGLTPEAIEFHASVMRDEKADVAARQRSADSILDRGGLVRGLVLATTDGGPLDGVPEADQAATLREIAIVALERLAASRAPDVEAKALPASVETPAIKADPEDPNPT